MAGNIIAMEHEKKQVRDIEQLPTDIQFKIFSDEIRSAKSLTELEKIRKELTAFKSVLKNPLSEYQNNKLYSLIKNRAFVIIEIQRIMPQINVLQEGFNARDE